MRTIVHLSDLHFNWIQEELVPKLMDTVRALKPNIVAISGDFTQHARPKEFERARTFVLSLPGHLIMVPGNHDMAFLNPWRRVTQRLMLYKQYITSDLQPHYSDAEVTIAGLNTARVSNLRSGRIREWQVDHIEEVMSRADPGAIRILVTHHPFDLPQSYAAAKLIGSRVMQRVVAAVDVLLAGHMHISHAAPTAIRYKLEGNSAIFVQAGTALSTRARGEPNAFQVIRTQGSSIEVEQYSENPTLDGFHPVKTTRFIRSESGWKAAALEVNPAATPEDMQLLRVEQRIASDIPGNEVTARHPVAQA
jgi:3',5'-cyclic AMP phosphodiesterase CpdA